MKDDEDLLDLLADAESAIEEVTQPRGQERPILEDTTAPTQANASEPQNVWIDSSTLAMRAAKAAQDAAKTNQEAIEKNIKLAYTLKESAEEMHHANLGWRNAVKLESKTAESNRSVVAILTFVNLLVVLGGIGGFYWLNQSHYEKNRLQGEELILTMEKMQMDFLGTWEVKLSDLEQSIDKQAAEIQNSIATIRLQELKPTLLAQQQPQAQTLPEEPTLEQHQVEGHGETMHQEQTEHGKTHQAPMDEQPHQQDEAPTLAHKPADHHLVKTAENHPQPQMAEHEAEHIPAPTASEVAPNHKLQVSHGQTPQPMTSFQPNQVSQVVHTWEEAPTKVIVQLPEAAQVDYDKLKKLIQEAMAKQPNNHQALNDTSETLERLKALEKLMAQQRWLLSQLQKGSAVQKQIDTLSQQMHKDQGELNKQLKALSLELQHLVQKQDLLAAQLKKIQDTPKSQPYSYRARDANIPSSVVIQ